MLNIRREHSRMLGLHSYCKYLELCANTWLDAASSTPSTSCREQENETPAACTLALSVRRQIRRILRCEKNNLFFVDLRISPSVVCEHKLA